MKYIFLRFGKIPRRKKKNAVRVKIFLGREKTLYVVKRPFLQHFTLYLSLLSRLIT